MAKDWASERYEVVSGRRVEILPEVFVSVGNPHPPNARVVIEAPRNIPIERRSYSEAKHAKHRRDGAG